MKIIDVRPTIITKTGQEGSLILLCDKCLRTFHSYYLGDVLNNGYTKEKSEEVFKLHRFNYCPFCGREIDWDNLQKRELEIYEVIDNE